MSAKPKISRFLPSAPTARPGPVPAARREFGENSGDGLSIRRRPFVV
jgi:hypothetical protein